ncbi:MAG: hypothetical protein ABSB10_00500 [Candidatus Bathyarchaeia archaeon]|jgi:hypothetical protein
MTTDKGIGDFLKPTIGHKQDAMKNAPTVVITKNKKQLKEIYKNVTESVLVACPTYRGKSYALEAYIRAYNDFVFPYRALFMVDNTGDGLQYYEHLKKLKVPCDHINPTNSFQETFAMSWKRIFEEAKKGGHKWVMSIEQDNICPPLTLDIMLNVAGFCNAVHVAHSYPWHKCQSDKGVFTGLGCNLILTELLDKIFARPKWYTDAFEAELTEYPKINGLVSLDVYNLIDVRHVDDEKGIEYYHFKKESIPELTHGVVKEKKPTTYK